jgi:hypothetical protein
MVYYNIINRPLLGTFLSKVKLKKTYIKGPPICSNIG